MDRDEFIITVYCLVCEHYQVIKDTYPLRRGGFRPALSDEEVITMELCGEYFKLATDILWLQVGVAHHPVWDDYPLPLVACASPRHSVVGRPG